jgi:hypothetical protein
MAGEKICTACGANAQAPAASGSPSDCICKPGYTGENGGTCIACVAGKYKLAAGNAVCTSCLAGQYSTIVAAATNTCAGCPANSNAPAASSTLSNCICNAGSQGPDGGGCV